VLRTSIYEILARYIVAGCFITSSDASWDAGGASDESVSGVTSRRRMGSIVILALVMASVAVGPMFLAEMLVYEARSAFVWASARYAGTVPPDRCNIKGNIN
jgi:hypothetical protein